MSFCVVESAGPPGLFGEHPEELPTGGWRARRGPESPFSEAPGAYGRGFQGEPESFGIKKVKTRVQESTAARGAAGRASCPPAARAAAATGPGRRRRSPAPPWRLSRPRTRPPARTRTPRLRARRTPWRTRAPRRRGRGPSSRPRAGRGAAGRRSARAPATCAGEPIGPRTVRVVAAASPRPRLVPRAATHLQALKKTSSRPSPHVFKASTTSSRPGSAAPPAFEPPLNSKLPDGAPACHHASRVTPCADTWKIRGRRRRSEPSAPSAL